MRAIRVASAALLGIGALALTGCTGPVANGDGGIGGFGYNVQPASVEPGGRLNLPVQGCNDNATVYSGAFEAVTIPRGRGSGTALVDRNVRPGEMYDVTFQCGRRYGHRRLAIAPGRGNDRDGGRYGGYDGGRGGGIGGGLDGGPGGAIGAGPGGVVGGALGGAIGGAIGAGPGGVVGGGLSGGLGGGPGGGLGGGPGGAIGGGPGGAIGGGPGGAIGGGPGGGGGRPGYEHHGVRAGLGGSISGFDPKKVGLGASLILGSVGAAWHMTRRRTTDGKS